MFLAEKGIDTIEWIAVDLNAGAHRDQAFVSKNPLAR
ncbi:MAG: glutathione S-transferase family protein, partial [Betaproteobacteria bacterium]|nr:glutathione S-transferase family protein [Betaproteobacteria bacterium]